MKKFGMLLATASLLVSSGMMAQEQAEEEIRYNQYGEVVERKPLQAEARDNILVFESKNKDYKLWFDARVQVDAAAFWGEDEDYDNIGNGASIRRARFAIKGQITKNWYGEFDMDFADGSAELKDAYIEYTGLKNFSFKAGNFKEDFSMERTTSSRYLLFMERPMAVNTFAPSRHLGFQVEYTRNRFRASAGAFLQEIKSSEELTYVQDNNKDFGRNQGYSFTGKVEWSPCTANRYAGLYVGANASYRTPKTDVETGDYGGIRYSTRNSTSINRKKYIDTDVIKNVDHNVLYGLESAGWYGPLRYQAEYIGSHVTAKKGSYDFDGWYAQASCLLFGGQQRFNASEGEFTRPNLGREWGDLELAVRYDYLSLNDNGIYGGSGQNYAVALNYYVNKNVKFALNYQFTDNDRYANGKGKLYVGHDANGRPTKDYTKVAEAKGKGGVSYHMLALRMQISF